jgi:hypothetical protein
MTGRTVRQVSDEQPVWEIRFCDWKGSWKGPPIVESKRGHGSGSQQLSQRSSHRAVTLRTSDGVEALSLSLSAAMERRTSSLLSIAAGVVHSHNVLLVPKQAPAPMQATLTFEELFEAHWPLESSSIQRL